MNLQDDLDRIDTIFIDTAPIIYFIEAHPQFGPLSKAVVNTFQSGGLTAFSSVITLTEVLPKPIWGCYPGKEICGVFKVWKKS